MWKVSAAKLANADVSVNERKARTPMFKIHNFSCERKPGTKMYVFFVAKTH